MTRASFGNKVERITLFGVVKHGALCGSNGEGEASKRGEMEAPHRQCGRQHIEECVGAWVEERSTR